MSEINPDTIQGAGSWGLFGCWLCVPVNADKNEVIKSAKERGSIDFDDRLVEQRLYGGFKCTHENKRHVYIATGQFTYLGTNTDLSPEDRKDQWEELMHHNSDSYIGGGPFCDDAPKGGDKDETTGE